MRIKIKIQNVENERLGINDEIKLTDLWFSEKAVVAFFHEEEELVFMINGREFTTPYTESKKIWFEKLLENNESCN